MIRLREMEPVTRRTPDIERAKSPEDAITIIPEEECNAGLKSLRNKFCETFPQPHRVCVVPILRSGFRLGRELTDHLGLKMNPMRMSYYDEDTRRLPEPICITKPDITQIISGDGSVLPVAFTECVVESQGTILAAMAEINNMIDLINKETGAGFPYPEYYTFAYVSKTGDNPVLIPNFTAAFAVNPDIWVGGRGCDLPGDKGRNLSHLVGILSPFAKKIPKRPYHLRIPI